MLATPLSDAWTQFCLVLEKKFLRKDKVKTTGFANSRLESLINAALLQINGATTSNKSVMEDSHMSILHKILQIALMPFHKAIISLAVVCNFYI